MQEKENILDILKKTKSAVKQEDVILIKSLSNRTVHTASIYQDPDNIIVAVIVYSLGKILEREKYQEYKQWPSFFKNLMLSLDSAISSLEKGNLEEFRREISDLIKSISNLSGHLKNYIEEVFRKARVNKASRIYEHGISMEQTAELLGISIFELAEYSGSTGIGDVDLSITKEIKERIKYADELFGR